MINNIAALEGNSDKVISQIEDAWFSALETEEYYAEFLKYYKSLFRGKSKIYAFNLFIKYCFFGNTKEKI